MNIDYSAIGKRIKDARREMNYTQESLAEKLEVSIGYISQVERGITKISLDLLGAISGILKKDIAFFVSGSNVSSENYLFSEITSDFALLSTRDKQLTANFIKLLLNRE